MSIQKKSLISTLKTAKKANVASKNTSDGETKGAKMSSMRMQVSKGVTGTNLRALRGLSQKSSKISLKSID